MSGDITSANTVFMIGAANVFASPQQLQNFSADDIFDVDALRVAEEMMGVDGLLSAGFVFEALHQTVRLMAGSSSGYVFDNVYQYEKASVSKVQLNAVVKFPSLGIKFTMQKGFMLTYAPMSAARKVLQPRAFGLSWESAVPSPIVGA